MGAEARLNFGGVDLGAPSIRTVRRADGHTPPRSTRRIVAARLNEDSDTIDALPTPAARRDRRCLRSNNAPDRARGRVRVLA